MKFQSKVRTCWCFDGGLREVADFYTSVIPDSRIDNEVRAPGSDAPLVIEFTLAGAPMMLLNAGPMFEHSGAASISVLTEDQDETDALWEVLTSGGGEEGQCGWVKDRFGVSWQVVPEALPRMFAGDDREAAGRAMQAMMQMKKIDIAAVKAAFNGE
jgi:predicted 3-demethylubiquinone-9 3-methyltransferase (glyoxalase superfamily)